MTAVPVAHQPDTTKPLPVSRLARIRSNAWIQAVRPHQWSKAFLVTTASFAALRFSGLILFQLAAAVALACMAASGTYLLNDAIDAPADRLHPVKRHRPVADGRISRSAAATTAAVLLSLAPVLGLLVSRATGFALGVYVVLTVAYSAKLKQIFIVDIVTIAAGFVVRVLIGATATRTTVSVWFLMAVGAASVMVAAGKRRGEVHELGDDAAAHRKALTQYRDAVTVRLLTGSASALFFSLVTWASIGKGGPHLEEIWAATVVMTSTVAIGRYLQIAMGGGASRPEQLIRDPTLQLTALATIALFLLGSLLS